jgi:hypothetical protein
MVAQVEKVLILQRQKLFPATPVITVVNNCGSSVLSTNAAGSLSWSTGGTDSSITVNTSGNYTVTVSNNGCGSTSAVAAVTVNDIPAVAAISGPTSVTVGGSVQLTNATANGVWSSNSAVATVDANTGLVTSVSVGTATISYTVITAAGCSTTVSASITVNPNCVIPAFSAVANITVNTTVGCTAAVSYVTNVSGSPAPAVTYIFSGATIGSGSGTGSGSVFNKGVTNVTVKASNSCGSKKLYFTITVIDATAPVITDVPDQSFCVSGASYTIPAISASDNCGITSVTYAVTGATTRTGTGYNASGAFNPGTSTITWKVKDAAENISTNSTIVTINAIPAASIVAGSANDFCNKLTLTGSSSVTGATYRWVYGNSTVGSNQQISLGQTNADGVYQLFVTANGCSSVAANYNFQKQNLASSYTILTFDDAKFNKYSKVASGSVGVMTIKGKAEFQKYSSISGAGSFVKAPKIDMNGYGISITTQIIGVANVTLPTMQYNTASAKYLPNYTAYSNNATLTANYNTLTVKRNVSITVTGNTFGTIRLEEGASIRFTNPVLNIETLEVDKGIQNNTYSYVRFAPNTSVRVSTKVKIGSEVLVNPENNKVTFYMGDAKCDDERFSVKGGDTRVIANIYMPDGKLKVQSTDSDNDDRDACDHNAHYSWNCKHKGHEHDDCDHKSHKASDCSDDVYMTGFFIVEKLESKGNTVIWNSFDCSAGPSTIVNSKKSTNGIVQTATSETAVTKATAEEELKVTVMPNPSTTYFTLKFESRYETPVSLRVMDGSGKVVDAKSKIGANSTIQIGHNYSSGTYYAEFVQGSKRQVIQLIKLRG